MKVGDMVYQQYVITAIPNPGLIIDEWEEWGVAGSRRARRQGWTVLWSTNAVFNHHAYELQVLHESG